MPEHKSAVFLREATGLVRDFGASDVILLSIGSIAPGFAWVILYTFMWFLYPGVNIPLAFVLTGFLAFFHGLYYVLISSAMPRSGGGGYVPLSRIIHPAFGLAASFLFVTYMLFTSAFTGTTVASIASGQLAAVGFADHNPGLQSLASLLTTPNYVFMVSAVLLIAAGVTVLAGPRVTNIANRIVIILILASFIAVSVILLGTSQSQFQAVFDLHVGSGAYQNVTATAQTAGLSISSDWITPTILSLPFAFFFMLGYEWNTYYSGEIKRVTRSMTLAVVVSIVFSTLIYALFSILIPNAFGYNFITSLGYLYNTGASQYPFTFAPYPNNLIALINGDILLNAFLILVIYLAGYYFLVTTILIVSRHILGWSFDRVFPSFLGAVSERVHGPVRAILLMIVLTLLVVAFDVFEPLILVSLSVTFFAITGILFEGLAGFFLIWRRKEILESAPAIVKKRIGGVPVVSLLGLYGFVFVAFLLVESILNPAIAGPLGSVTEGSLVFAFVLGLVTYFAFRAYHRSRGMDISLAFGQIPPE